MKSQHDEQPTAPTDYDVVVVGAGPAGALSAYLAGRAGLKTALVDKGEFPRDKVCGCCLNGSVARTLQLAGLGDLPSRLGALPLNSFELVHQTRRVVFPLCGGVALSRVALDAALVEAAVQNGVVLLTNTKAKIADWDALTNRRAVELCSAGDLRIIRAKVVVAACGLAHGSLPPEVLSALQTRKGSRIGLGAKIPHEQFHIAPGSIQMHLVDGGYIGVTALEDKVIDIAAALTPSAISRLGKSGALLGPLGLDTCVAERLIRGTPPLSRQMKQLAWPGLFLVGDSAGYTEPFTGEGVGLALQGAATLAPLLLSVAGVGNESAEGTRATMAIANCRWNRTGKALLRSSRRRLLFLSWLTQYPGLALALAWLVAQFGIVRTPLLRTVSHSFAGRITP